LAEGRQERGERRFVILGFLGQLPAKLFYLLA
jgi:hypothetical protein